MSKDTRKNILNSYRVRYGESQQQLAEALGVVDSTLSCKLNGHREFTRPEARFIIDRYKIDDEDAVNIFLR